MTGTPGNSIASYNRIIVLAEEGNAVNVMDYKILHENSFSLYDEGHPHIAFFHVAGRGRDQLFLWHWGSTVIFGKLDAGLGDTLFTHQCHTDYLKKVTQPQVEPHFLLPPLE